MIDLFQTQKVSSRSEAADRDYHDDHRERDEPECSHRPVLLEHSSNQKASYHAAEPAAGINEADSLSTDASGIQLQLDRRERLTTEIGAKCDQCTIGRGQVDSYLNVKQGQVDS